MTFARAGVWVAVAVLAAGLFVVGGGRESFGPAAPGVLAPDYAAATLDGDTLALEDLRGSVVVLNAWATWCKPCVTEMPSLERLHRRFRDRGLAVVGVSMDATNLGGDDPLRHVREFVEAYELTFTILHDASGAFERAFAFNGLPTTFIIDRDGRVVERVLGPHEWDRGAYAAKIEALLAN